MVLENPQLFLVEVVWRWSFGTVALLLSIQGFASVLGHATISDGTWAALHTQDVTSAANALADLILAFWKVICLALAVLLPALALAWFLAATWGRAATMKILRQSSALAVVAGSNLLRVLLVLLTGVVIALVIAGAAMLSARFSANPSEPNLALYLLIVLVALPLILIVWGALNWMLSLVPLFAFREKNGLLGSLAATLRSLRASRSAYWSVSGVYGTVRGIALIVVIVLGFALGALGENPIVLGLLGALVLVYFAFADLLYVARMAAYLQIADRTYTKPTVGATTGNG